MEFPSNTGDDNPFSASFDPLTSTENSTTTNTGPTVAAPTSMASAVTSTENSARTSTGFSIEQSAGDMAASFAPPFATFAAVTATGNRTISPAALSSEQFDAVIAAPFAPPFATPSALTSFGNPMAVDTLPPIELPPPSLMSQSISSPDLDLIEILEIGAPLPRPNSPISCPHIEHVTCSICHEIFIKPRVLDCGHSFCEYCISKWRKTKNVCPICRDFIMREPIKNIAFDDVCESIVKGLSHDIKIKREETYKQRLEEMEIMKQERLTRSMARGVAEPNILINWPPY